MPDYKVQITVSFMTTVIVTADDEDDAEFEASILDASDIDFDNVENFDIDTGDVELDDGILFRLTPEQMAKIASERRETDNG